jgi:hypothetical protein
MTGVKDCAAEGVECVVERRGMVMGEAFICMLAREKAFESEEESVEAGGGCVDGVQHCVDGRWPGKAARLTHGPVQRPYGALQLQGGLLGLVVGLGVTADLSVVVCQGCTPEGADPPREGHS